MSTQHKFRFHHHMRADPNNLRHQPLEFVGNDLLYRDSGYGYDHGLELGQAQQAHPQQAHPQPAQAIHQDETRALQPVPVPRPKRRALFSLLRKFI